MSDYLRNLAARNLRSVEVIQPRLASLYEPTASSESILNQEIHSERFDTHVDHQKLDQNSGNSKPSELISQQPLSQQLPSDISQPSLDYALTADPVAIPVIRNEKNNTATARDLTSVLPEHEIVPDTSDKSSNMSVLNDDTVSGPATLFIENVSSPAIHSRLNTVHETDNGDHNPSVYGTKGEHIPFSDDSKISENAFKLNHKSTTRLDGEESPPVNNPSQNLPNLSVVKPANAHNKQDKYATRTTNPEPEPVIRVTIGRVDVRAVTPPPLSIQQKTRQSNPTLSLDDYLRKRNGGGTL